MLSHFSRVWLYVTLWTAAVQSPLATGFSRQEYWSGLPFPSHTCICTYLYTYTCICTYTHMYMHAHAHTHMHMHTHTHIGTYTHIPLTDPVLGTSLHTRPSSPPQRCPTWKSWQSHSKTEDDAPERDFQVVVLGDRYTEGEPQLMPKDRTKVLYMTHTPHSLWSPGTEKRKLLEAWALAPSPFRDLGTGGGSWLPWFPLYSHFRELSACSALQRGNSFPRKEELWEALPFCSRAAGPAPQGPPPLQGARLVLYHSSVPAPSPVPTGGIPQSPLGSPQNPLDWFLVTTPILGEQVLPPWSKLLCGFTLQWPLSSIQKCPSPGM